LPQKHSLSKLKGVLLIFKLRLKVLELAQVQALKQRKERRVKVLTALLSPRRLQNRQQLKRNMIASRRKRTPNLRLLRTNLTGKRKRRRMKEIPRSRLRLTTSPS